VSPDTSNSPISRDTPSTLAGVIGPEALRFGARLVAGPVRFVSFWIAVALPFCYLPLLLGGLGGGEAVAFAALVGVHVVSLLAGHDHARE
jgi:hypothetical protein